MQNQGTIISVDFSAKRMKTWQKEIARMGTKIAEPVVADARVSVPLVGEADLASFGPTMHQHRRLCQATLSKMAPQPQIHREHVRTPVENDQQLRRQSQKRRLPNLLNLQHNRRRKRRRNRTLPKRTPRLQTRRD